MDSQTIVLIVLIILTLILIGVSIYVTFRTNPTIGGGGTTSGTTGLAGSPGLPGVFQPCNFDNNNTNVNDLGSTGLCSTGTICAKNNICFIDLGGLCTNYSQCTPAANTCSGRCASGAVGLLNQYCPCKTNLGFVCKTLPSGYGTCVYENGYPCTNDTQCLNQCINGFCSGGLPEGSPCNTGQCLSPFVCNSSNYCQPPGVQNGQQNAYCNDTNPALFCFSPLSCVNNECVSTSSGLGTSCSNSVCNLPLECEAQPPVPPNTSSNFQICVFPDNNTCTINCSPGFTCDLNNHKCIAGNGLSCLNNTNCTSTNCVVNSTLLYWDGSKFTNLATAPTDTFKRIVVEYRTGVTQANLYMLGVNALYYYTVTTNSWSVVFTNPTSLGTIIDCCVDHNNKLWLLINTGGPNGAVVVDANFTPTTQFGTPNGNLIIGTTVIPLTSIDIDINNRIVSGDANGKVYINTVQQVLPPTIGASKVRAFGNDPTKNNFAYLHFLVNTVGQLNNNTFPLFPDNGSPYINVTDYAIHVQNSLTVPSSVDAANSVVYMIATTDGVNYSIVLNNGAYQTQIPSYVSSDTLIGSNGTSDMYIHTTHACV